MIDFSTIEDDLIKARGMYATVNSTYKAAMSEMQALTQRACDDLRHALQDEPNRHHHFEHAEKMMIILSSLRLKVDELKAQKDELYQAAWGK
jgi:hypothetical protein